ncbi:MAG TPA: hypothetical protein VGG20_23535 [Thermoanaerobaculia bacterium]|jgi:hypothetical protein
MKRSLCVSFGALLLTAGLSASAQDWPQWGHDSQHTGTTSAIGQPAQHILADVVYDPFTAQEKADPLSGGDLLAHYQTPLVDGDNVYMEFKTGTYTTLDHWETQIWNEKRLEWNHGHLVTDWTFQSDWKPVPYGSASNGPAFEPVFHAVLSGNFVYVPGAGGSIFKIAKSDGHLVARIMPIAPSGPALDPDTFTASPLTADAAGNIYYTTLKLNHGNPWDADIVASSLVKVSPAGVARSASITSLTPGAPHGNDKCLGVFNISQLPWPPSPTAVPTTVTCGTQRVGLNSAPAVAPDGTIYLVSVAHLWSRESYLIAANSDLSPKWHASMRDRLHDGCNVLLPPNGTPNGCRVGAATGVDPAQNRPGAGRVIDDNTASPIVAPDGAVFYGAYTRFNYFQGHLMKFSSTGQFLAAYRFGWDDTPAIYAHDGTYSVITKDNQYGDSGSYCDDETFCPSDRTTYNPSFPEAYFITRLDKDLHVESRWQNLNPLSCTRDASGNVTCVNDHPVGFEFCVNAPAVDRFGNVYNNSEDGNLYVVRPNGTLREHLFLDSAVGAAYTPLAIGADGKIYTQNDGHLFVVGR